ncbi:RNA polymerase [Aureococcus anophagefferens]|nr:RNA polymerase [Aureococcus anophagefferens]
MASPEAVEQARNTDIVAVAEHLGLELETRGAATWALCPFHDERTASFSLNSERGLYKCFGCGAGGDVIKLWRELRPDATFPEAVAGICAAMRRAVAAAAAFYAAQLAERAAARRRAPVPRAAASAAAAAKFGVGFSPPGGDRSALLAGARGKFDRDDLAAAGVLYPRRDPADRRVWDRFAGKLVLPIRDASGACCGFGSRHVDEASARGPKYVNSPATPLFLKRACLFGLDVAKRAIADRDEAIIVEGYFDVLALHDVGVEHVVASLGVGISPEQLERAARFSPSRRVVLCLDGDAAGAAAVRRLCEQVLPKLSRDAGVDACVAFMPGGAEDASDFIAGRRAAGADDAAIADEIRAVADDATPWLEHETCVVDGGPGDAP